MLSYIQGRSVDVWKKNILKDLKGRLLEYETVGEFLANIRKEFSGGDKESIKVTELKRLEQGEKMIKEFVQKFKRAARESRYKERLLIEEFKREINTIIYWRLIKSE